MVVTRTSTTQSRTSGATSGPFFVHESETFPATPAFNLHFIVCGANWIYRLVYAVAQLTLIVDFLYAHLTHRSVLYFTAHRARLSFLLLHGIDILSPSAWFTVASYCLTCTESVAYCSNCGCYNTARTFHEFCSPVPFLLVGVKCFICRYVLERGLPRRNLKLE